MLNDMDLQNLHFMNPGWKKLTEFLRDWLHFFLCYSTFNGKPSLLLDNLFVQESARGVKIGEKLVTKISCRALELNCSRIELLVEKNNPACAFYKKFGFPETADRVYSITSEGLKGTGKIEWSKSELNLSQSQPK